MNTLKETIYQKAREFDKKEKEFHKILDDLEQELLELMDEYRSSGGDMQELALNMLTIVVDNMKED